MPTVWIVGTSVSIEDGGYATQLSKRLAGRGVTIRNLSVGDQTSVMGLMRVLAHIGQIVQGDIVIWEYTLLDTILTETLASPEDVCSARRQAWRKLMCHGASIVVLLTPPRANVAERTPYEAIVAKDALVYGLPCIDMREVAETGGYGQLSEAQYRDDRHVAINSPVLTAVVDRLVQVIGQPRWGRKWWSRARYRGEGRDWSWLDAAALRKNSGQSLTCFENSLMSVEALALGVEGMVDLPAVSRVVAVGIVSTHYAGGLWCGHNGCAPASAQLPVDLPYKFLLRASAVPCVRPTISRLVSAPDWAYQGGIWADRGQRPSETPGEVAVFGLLYVPA